MQLKAGSLRILFSILSFSQHSLTSYSQNFCFASTTGISVVEYVRPISVCSGDFNGDGKPDMSYVSNSGTDVVVKMGNGNGTFTQANNYQVGTNPNEVITKDVNGDTKLDLIVVNSGDGTVSVLKAISTNSFSPAQSYFVGITPKSITSADFNNDTYIDIAVANSGSNNVSILLGSPTGTFSSFGSAITVGANPSSIKAVDLNNDGKIDLAVANSGSNYFSVLNGLGYGTFSSATSYPVGGNVASISFADLNEDGLQDIIVANRGGTGSSIECSSIAASMNNGLGFNAPQFYLASFPEFVTTADINLDGNVDVLCVNDNAVSVFLGNGSGLLENRVNFLTGYDPTSIVCEDFNSDGEPDLLVANQGTTANNSSVSLLIGNGNGDFEAIISYPFRQNQMLQYPPSGLVSDDFNNDGKKDLALCTTFSTLSVMLSRGDGTFLSPVNYSVSPSLAPTAIETSDFNNDGNMDIALACHSTTNKEVLILLGNGMGDFSISGHIAISSTPLAITTNDFNGDGKMDIALSNNITNDVSIILGNGMGGGTLLANFPVGSQPYFIISADFNSDNIIDLATSNYLSGNVSILIGNGSGTFASPANYSAPNPTGLTSGDFNNDGKIDLAVSNAGSNSFVVMLGTTAGTYSISGSYQASGAECIEAVDINNDGKLDIVTSSPNGYLLFLKGNGNGSFATGNYVAILPIDYLVVEDFNGDGLKDVAVAGNVDAVTIIRNQTAGIQVLGSNIICVGSSLNLSGPKNCYSYTWQPGGTHQDNLLVSASGVYSLTVSNLNGCVTTKTASIIITVDNTCQDVWPGDANSDGLADNLDVLELGLHYTQTGLPRATASNNWQSYFSNNWTGTISNGKNLNHSDCNGDGIINDNDTLAIYNNYGLTHAFKTAQTNTVNLQLSIVPDQASAVKGTWATASIYLGDAATNINNINGVAFTIDFDNTLIETNSIYIEYQNSFLDAGQNLDFRKLDFINGKIFTASTHTVSNNVNGFGKIATLHYQIKSNLATDQVLNIGLSQANQSNASGAIVPLTSGAGTLMAIGASVGLQELNANVVSISPNPTNRSLTINSKTELQKIEVVAITGQILLSEVPTNVSHTLHLDNFANGIYFVNLYQNNRIVKREKVVLNK